MITCNLMGGLGNQIFQIFTVISYAIKSKKIFKFTNAKTLGDGNTTIRHTYWDSFLYKLKPFITDTFPQLHLIREKGYAFNELPIYDKNIILYGYFQSYKYFQQNYETICKIICLKQMKEDLLKKKQYDIDVLNNTISMHFRLGDYKKNIQYHPIMSKEYYEKCIHYIRNSDKLPRRVLFFCEDEDISEVRESVKYLSTIFPDIEFVRADNTLEDWEQMLLMSCCRHNIIANSSFSWWGAYFNDNSDKIVCYPSKWFGEIARSDTKDLCPDNWIKIKA